VVPLAPTGAGCATAPSMTVPSAFLAPFNAAVAASGSGRTKMVLPTARVLALLTNTTDAPGTPCGFNVGGCAVSVSSSPPMALGLISKPE